MVVIRNVHLADSEVRRQLPNRDSDVRSPHMAVAWRLMLCQWAHMPVYSRHKIQRGRESEDRNCGFPFNWKDTASTFSSIGFPLASLACSVLQNSSRSQVRHSPEITG